MIGFKCRRRSWASLPGVGFVTGVDGQLLRVKWSSGEESTVVPAAGSLVVIGKVKGHRQCQGGAQARKVDEDQPVEGDRDEEARSVGFGGEQRPHESIGRPGSTRSCTARPGGASCGSDPPGSLTEAVAERTLQIVFEELLRVGAEATGVRVEVRECMPASWCPLIAPSACSVAGNTRPRTRASLPCRPRGEVFGADGT